MLCSALPLKSRYELFVGEFEDVLKEFVLEDGEARSQRTPVFEMERNLLH